MFWFVLGSNSDTKQIKRGTGRSKWGFPPGSLSIASLLHEWRGIIIRATDPNVGLKTRRGLKETRLRGYRGILISLTGIILTGPINPDCWSGEVFFQRRQEVKL